MKWQDTLSTYRKQRFFEENKWVDEKCGKFNEYLKQHGISGAVLSVSGGVDSAVTLALLVHTMSLPDSNLKKICSILDFKKSILKFLTLQKLVKQKKLLLG